MDNSEFDQFWLAYPRKCAKADARKAWLQTASIRPAIDVLLAAVEAARASDQWRRDEGRYIPYPATWLRGERWEDEHEVAVVPIPEKKHDITAGWWVSETRTLDMARKLGLESRAGEDWNAFRSRIRAALVQSAA